ncbi:glycoside hydrolase family 88 protein [Arthrobacter tumbae]|uniref:glycoside hydrolase family 88 protein n=1 Tax=Arthrobacter tumbae TaxID=163874 RepID=UPI00195D0A57|nr:glycoside hydrolase family 88 protein [Arthrobacter tumbae]MBM7781943.1 unsaturated chondroitin disaccharide hydrolase [Arthrobacter tumbae]
MSITQTSPAQPDTMQDLAQQALEDVRRGVEPVLEIIEGSPAGAVPGFKYTTGGYQICDVYLPHDWSTFQWVGFLTGRLWLVADHFDDDRIRAAAHKLARVVADSLSKEPPRFSAAGSDLFYASCLGARLTGDTALTNAALEATRQYSKNFDERLGVFFQVLGVNRAVIDTGLNLLPFYWSAASDPELADIARRHNTNLLNYGIVRGDGSAYQAIEFDLETGQPARRYSMQGYSDSTTWSRGQSWAMHNYVNVYEATGDRRFLEVARNVCRWYVDHLPEDSVPFYDFADPQAPAVPRDSCSATIAANALLRLARLDQESAGWASTAADAIARELFTNYLSPGGVLLHSSWGRLPAEKAGAGFSRFPLEDVMPYGNYWVVEAAYRYLHSDWSPLELAQSAPLHINSVSRASDRTAAS